MAKLDLSIYGITDVKEILHNPSYEELYKAETDPKLEGYEKGYLTELGAVNVMTGLLHLEAGIQSLRENVLQACRRIGDLQAALDGLRYLASLPNLVVHADLIAGLPLYSLEQMIEDVRVLAAVRFLHAYIKRRDHLIA